MIESVKEHMADMTRTEFAMWVIGGVLFAFVICWHSMWYISSMGI